jgi:hypothetical protein
MNFRKRASWWPYKGEGFNTFLTKT